MAEPEEPQLIVSDVHRRITGVGATVRTLLPYIARREPTALVSRHRHGHFTTLSLWQALRLCWRRPKEKPFRIWHARRNNEMLWALAFKHLFRCRLKLVLTSCALRRHSWFPRKLIAAMDAIIATSDEAAGYVDNVVAVIPHGVDCERFQPPADRRAAMRALGIPGEHAVGICGRIRPEKGTDLFVEAMIRLLPELPEFTACIVGRATAEFAGFQKRLKQKIADAGLEDRIVWLGEIDYQQMPLFYGALSLCVTPARYEGFGLTALEAMACGVPVAASRTGCYGEAIVPGATGELVDCGDGAALTAALRQWMHQPEQLAAMGPACRARVLENYSAEVEADEIVKVYHLLWANAA
jgi:mannosyltransferase